jgi:hypothetical protein
MDHITKLLIGFLFLLTLFFGQLQPSRAMDAMDAPDTVEIDSLSQLFEPVTFNHAMHLDVADSCATCHHHTTGTPVKDPNCVRCHANSGPADTVACRDCHAAKRFEADYLNKLDEDNKIYHVDKVGLKAAYHIRCLNCHKEMGAPEGCEDCHARTEAGDQFYHEGKYAPPKDKKPYYWDRSEE